MSSLVKNLLFALGLAVIIWIGYTVFLKEEESSILESSGSVDSGNAELQAQQFLVRLQRLKRVDIDGEVFSDPRFTSLVNFRQELGTEPTGRANPFAPVE